MNLVKGNFVSMGYPTYEGQQVGRIDLYPTLITLTDIQLKNLIKSAIKEALEEYNKK